MPSMASIAAPGSIGPGWWWQTYSKKSIATTAHGSQPPTLRFPTLSTRAPISWPARAAPSPVRWRSSHPQSGSTKPSPAEPSSKSVLASYESLMTQLTAPIGCMRLSTGVSGASRRARLFRECVYLSEEVRISKRQACHGDGPQSLRAPGRALSIPASTIITSWYWIAADRSRLHHHIPFRSHNQHRQIKN
jgi:hypothetical protein